MRTRDILSAFVIIPLLFSCSHKPPPKAVTTQMNTPIRAPVELPNPPDPAGAAVQAIRRQYRAEFEQLVFPRPGRTPALGAAAMRCRGFPKTLQAIADFERRYGRKTPQQAHLTILKGMIHLQCDRFRSASAMEPDIRKAAARLTSSPDSKGSALLARNFGRLMTGWREIHDHEENMKARDAGKPFPFASANFKQVHLAADYISEDLRRYAAENPKIVGDPASDLDGLYVAAVAAAFYTWVQGNNDRGCGVRDSADCTLKRRQNKSKAVFYRKGRDLIGLFLTESEKSSALHGRHAPGLSSCRRQYLNWYGWLSERVHGPGSQHRPKGMVSR